MNEGEVFSVLACTQLVAIWTRSGKSWRARPRVSGRAKVTAIPS
jgi:hypothetical protein